MCTPCTPLSEYALQGKPKVAGPQRVLRTGFTNPPEESYKPLESSAKPHEPIEPPATFCERWR